MEPMTLAVAGVAALAVVLIALGVATSGGSGISDRLERYAAKPKAARKPGETGQGGVAELIATSQALNSLNRVVEQRDFGANLARDIARADLHLKPSEFLVIWAGSIVGVPLLMIFLSAFFPALRNPLFLLIGGLVGFLLPRFWLARRRTAGWARSTSSCPTRSRSSPTPCEPVRRSSRRSNWSYASRARRSRPSSAGSSAKSTSASRSTRRSRTWSAGSARTTSS